MMEPWSSNRWLAEEEDGGKSTRDIVGAVLSNFFLFFLIFGMSATVDCKNLRRQISNTFAIGTGLAMQFLCMPVLGYVAVTACKHHGLTEAVGITLLVLTSSPGGSYSNWWCSTFNADLALSVAMTTVSSLMSIALLPANLFLFTYLAYGGAQNDDGQTVIEALDFKTLFSSLAVVLSAILSGLAAGYKYDTHRFHVACNRMGSMFGICLIVYSVFLSSGANGAESKLWNQPGVFYAAVAFPCLLGIALSNIVARSVRLSPPETVAISIECCYQNTGIATSVAITMFSNVEDRAQAVAVPLFYGVVEAVAVGVYCIIAWKSGVRTGFPISIEAFLLVMGGEV
jgi:predicted Na+-dependent transporter